MSIIIILLSVQMLAFFLMIYRTDAFAPQVLIHDCYQLLVYVVEKAEDLQGQMVLVVGRGHFLQIYATKQIDSFTNDIENVEEYL